ncbi:uncharacterized protein LOC6550886 [Drosophila erecta]|uniref:Uncharacterized protein n=1 Tax=Drosophila erecta TaxID=7220 RepID=B3NST0_DROER|nr:uncharacterized protein LOC6550886 [Drosophila erecta]EDV45760.1 uncharacterized protein Dere_GG18682 [Drosophila erecta]
MITEKEHPLDNCQLFVQLRKFLHEYAQSTKILNHIIYWSGNEEHIKSICDHVVGLLLEHELILQVPHGKHQDLVARPNGPAAMNHLRGLLVYLVLNRANEQFLGDSQWSAHVIHLCYQLPAIPQLMTIAIALNCGLQQPLEEFLACGPRWLTFQYFETFNEVLSHIHVNWQDTLPLLFAALKAAGRAIVNHNLPEENKRLLRQMASMLQRHLLDSDRRLKTLPRASTRRIYLAKVMEQLLEVLLDTLNDPQKREKPKCFAIYSQMSVDISASYSNDHVTDLRLFALILLDSLQRIFHLISVDTFMHWLEMPSPRLLYSYQELICSQTAELLKLVQSDEELKQHSVCKQMQGFAEAAKTLEQRIAELTIGELLAFLDGDLGDQVTNEQALAGLDNLFSRFIAFGNDECLETMANHLHLLTKKHAQIIINYLGQVVLSKMVAEDEGISVTEVNHEDDEDNEQDEILSNEEEEDEGLLNMVLRPLFMQLNVNDKIEVLLLRDEQNVTKGFNFEAPDHRERRIRFFNRLDINKSFPMDEFLVLCYENANKTWIDFSRLAVTHTRFTRLFWRLAAQFCPKLTAFHISACADDFLMDEILLQKPNALRFLLYLYGQRQILNGLYISSRHMRISLKDGRCPYGKEQLKQTQNQFLEACANGLAKFRKFRDFPSLQIIFRLLLMITVSEKHLIFQGARQLTTLEKEQPKSEAGDDADDVKMARHYTNMHACLPEWRLNHWSLISQVIKTIDALRWDLATFEEVRVNTLEMAVQYWGHGLSHLMFLNGEFRKRVLNLVSKLTHKDFWIVHLTEDSSNNTRCVLRLLTQSTASEATKLFTKVLNNHTDCAVVGELSDAVVKVNRESAFRAFKYLFRQYLIAFRNHTRIDKTCTKRQHWDHLMAVVAKAPFCIRNEITEQASAFAVRFDIDIQTQQRTKSLIDKEMP